MCEPEWARATSVLFTPRERVELVRNDFSGFRLEDRHDVRNTRESLLRRVIHLEDLVKDLMARVKSVEKGNEIMKANTEVLKKNYDDLKNKVCASEKKMEDNEDQVKKISEKQNHWKMDQDQRRVSFKKIIEESAKEREQEVAKTVVKAEKVVMEVKDDEGEGKRLSKEIEEVYRLGKDEEGNTRLLKIRIRSQASAEEILADSWRLERREAY
ncbi:hypothetical protein E2C01_079693 [Portunus trituberculatus]|uniref:Uncharacterized protein n=1 Tax=Portunus trituberculatus TaxID=210409 RepID=A0A5B7IS10_PORTR|nr:hypothetical protein [Portunus trituberculatus]